MSRLLTFFYYVIFTYKQIIRFTVSSSVTDEHFFSKSSKTIHMSLYKK